MITNFKMAQVDNEKLKLQSEAGRNIKTSRSARKKPQIRNNPRFGLKTSRYNPDYSSQKLINGKLDENFTDMLKECIIKDIKK